MLFFVILAALNVVSHLVLRRCSAIKALCLYSWCFRMRVSIKRDKGERLGCEDTVHSGRDALRLP